jgi:aspartyl-tRNA(Asn)/glutamyl-tRNA(Gln) amidotransferase subunit A
VDDLVGLSARELLSGYRRRRFSPVEVFEALAARIEQLDPELGAFTTLCLERALDEARAAERLYARGQAAGALGGVPFGVKDLFDSEGVRTTYGSPMFAGHVPAVDAEAVRRARDAGAVLIGKTQTHEFAWGITSVNRLMGTSRNPWEPTRMSGGSSGGSAVALAAHLVPLALGSDTGGSIRVPSGFCGTVGLKPTYGRVSTTGVFPLARSLDHPGPMARTPADAALLLAAIAGLDERDPATQNAPLGNLDAALAAGLTGMRVGICPDLHLVPLAPDVDAAFMAAVESVEHLGGELVQVEFPAAERLYETFGVIQRAEALFSHTQAGLFPARRDEYGRDLLGRLELATQVELSDYLAASEERQRARAGFDNAFGRVDVLLTPVAAASPLPIGEERTMHLGTELDFRELVMSYTVPQDLTGLPALAVRIGFDHLGIPVGAQFTAPPWGEARVLRAAQALFEGTPEIQRRRPTLPCLAPDARDADSTDAPLHSDV